MWGAAFKPHSDDVRDSPALSIAGQLHLRGATGHRSTTRRRTRPPARCSRRSTTPSRRWRPPREADLLLHLTEWPEFREVDLDALGATVRRKQVLDGRNVLDLDAWRAAGWTARGLGRR